MSADELDIWLAHLRRPLRWPDQEAFGRTLTDRR
jgi:hypothetical protein